MIPYIRRLVQVQVFELEDVPQVIDRLAYCVTDPSMVAVRVELWVGIRLYSEGAANPAGDRTEPVPWSVRAPEPMPGWLQVIGMRRYHGTAETPD